MNAVQPHTDSETPSYSVSALNIQASQLLETELGYLCVNGELHEIRRPGSGHWYFTLKDDTAELRCVMFRSSTAKVQQALRQGDQINVYGHLTVYKQRGQYQLIARRIEAAGEGLLLKQYEQLRNKLRHEGLFDQERKLPLPSSPAHIAVVTSATGAALRDVLTVLQRRCPWLDISLIPTTVQGDTAPASICQALDRCENFNQHAMHAHSPLDLVLLCRGGGSLEDLWAFNDEAVVRRVAALSIPSISGVGHATDTTLTDFAADARAATPSAAAEILSEQLNLYPRRLHQCTLRLQQEARRQIHSQQQRLAAFHERLITPARYLEQRAQHLDDLSERLKTGTSRLIQNQRQRLTAFHERLITPARYLEQRTQHLDGLSARLTTGAMRQRLYHQNRINSLRKTLRSQLKQPSVLNTGRVRLAPLKQRLTHSMTARTHKSRQRIERLHDLLNSMNPMRVLDRGYAIVRNPEGTVLSNANQTKPNELLQIQLTRGSVKARVEETASTSIPPALPENP
ncbi:MAG: exodeoxyribonuclease VII large subunit [Gammaproteobacteria bacterium]